MLQEFIHLFAPLTANCKDFKQRWDSVAGLDPGGIGGRWEGEWASDATGHRGPLHCVLSVVAPELWHVTFRASYSRLLRACYTTDFNVAQHDGRWTFSGGSDLGAIAGGRYDYAGTATLIEMICTYTSARDRGEFRLRRSTPHV